MRAFACDRAKDFTHTEEIVALDTPQVFYTPTPGFGQEITTTVELTQWPVLRPFDASTHHEFTQTCPDDRQCRNDSGWKS